jgi:aspartate/methionine/tyrosine aminotransferase
VKFFPFALERWQSTWEHRCRINLSESGVHALTAAELLALGGGSAEELATLPLGYGQSDGSEALRVGIARLYPGASPDQVTVTVGSAEANFVACWALFPGAKRIAILAPAYMQTWGLAQNFGNEVAPFWLDPAREWALDAASLERAVRPGTDVVIVTDPNNPTGRVLTHAEREAIVERTRAVGAWLLVDEVFQGAERVGPTTPTWWGRWERTLIVNGLSKAYGLPGLRIGWIVSPPVLRDPVMERHDYTVIGPGPLADYLAVRAIEARERLFARTRGIVSANYPVLAEWLGGFDGLFEWHAPACGAICFVRCRSERPTLALVEQLRAEHDILLVPGDHFEMPGWLRFGLGNRPPELREALEVLTPAFGRLAAARR